MGISDLFGQVLHTPEGLLMGLLGALALVGISFLNTHLALMFLIFAMLLSPEIPLGGVPGRSVVVRFDDLFLLAVVTGWFTRLALEKRLSLLEWTPLNRPILAYIFLCVVSTVVGGVRGTTDPVVGVFYIVKYVEYFMVFFMVSNIVVSRRQVKTYLVAMMFVCLLVGTYGVLVSLKTGIRATAPFEGREGEPNTLAGYLILMMSIGLSVFLSSVQLYDRLVFASFVLYLLCPLILTYSRGGWLGFGMMYLYTVITAPRGRVPLVLVVLIMGILVVFFAPRRAYERVKETFVQGQYRETLAGRIPVDDSAGARLRALRRSVRRWQRDWLTVLIGNGVPAGGSVSDVQYGRILREVGIVGMVIFLWMMWRVLLSAYHAASLPGLDRLEEGMCRGLAAAVPGLLLMGIAAEVFIIIRIMEPFWFVAGMVSALPRLVAEGRAGLASGSS